MNPLKEAEKQMLDKLFAIHGIIKTPECAICQRACDKFSVSYKPLERIYVFELECHGDKCHTPIHEELALNPEYKFVINQAFTPDQSRVDGIVRGTIH